MSINKLLTGVAMGGLVAGAAFADEPAPTPGDPQEAIVNQIGDENYAIVDQALSAEGEVLIRQTGDLNEAIVFQADDGSDHYDNPANTAEIEQVGDRALAVIAQGDTTEGSGGYGNDASIKQYGNADDTPGANPSDSPAVFPLAVDGRLYTNAAGVGQIGDGNEAGIRQGTESRAVRGNVAGIGQAGLGNKSLIDQQADGALAANVQFGSNNLSSISQHDASGLYNAGGETPWDPEAVVFQTGSDNVSSVDQVGGDVESGDLSAFVNQYGDNSDSAISQTASGDGFQGNLNAYVEQGSLSTSTIEQSATGDHAVNALAEVKQDNGATSTITQALNGDGANQAKANVDQDGASFSNIEQTIDSEWGSVVDAAVNQSGDFNSSDIKQEVSETATAAHHLFTSVTQTGNGNDSDVDQTFVNEASHSFTAIVSQSGDNNGSEVSQTDSGLADGDSNLMAVVDQSGDYNVSEITQENDWQSAYVDQHGVNGYSKIDQIESGSANTAVVFQAPGADGTSSIITQGGFGSPDSMYNEAFVTQEGRYITSAIEQVGIGNLAEVEQTPDAEFSNVTIKQFNGNEVGPGNIAYAGQEGSHGNAFIDQTGEANLTSLEQGGSYELAMIDQVGMDNFVSLEQYGEHQNANISQDGEYNGVEVGQYALYGELIIDQAGTGNWVWGEQFGEGVFATISQDGTGNDAEIEQGGYQNTLDIAQSGTGNYAGVGQYGDFNAAVVNQVGYGNEALVIQGGGVSASPVLNGLFGGGGTGS